MQNISQAPGKSGDAIVRIVVGGILLAIVFHSFFDTADLFWVLENAAENADDLFHQICLCGVLWGIGFSDSVSSWFLGIHRSSRLDVAGLYGGDRLLAQFEGYILFLREQYRQVKTGGVVADGLGGNVGDIWGDRTGHRLFDRYNFIK